MQKVEFAGLPKKHETPKCNSRYTCLDGLDFGSAFIVLVLLEHWGVCSGLFGKISTKKISLLGRVVL